VALVRTEIGDVLRDFRLQKGQTLRQVASRASVALGAVEKRVLWERRRAAAQGVRESVRERDRRRGR
jgi:transcriptional regulator with XRE-family HTH domain